MPINLTANDIRRMTRKQKVMFWGQECSIKPYFVKEAMGDGMRLIAITPLNTRPNYYLIRVDSKWWMDADRLREDLPPENRIAEHIDEICEVIESEVGPRYMEDDNGEDVLAEWPSLNDECGVCWCDAMDLIQKKGKRR